MSLTTTVLFENPHTSISDIINRRIQKAKQIQIVSGFITVEGIKTLERALRLNTSAVQCPVIGAATYRAFEAIEYLTALGVAQRNIYVHLGYNRSTSNYAKSPFLKYHPMLHSKIYYFENEDMACALIGSHNVTGFALLGLNGEAAVMLEGRRDDFEFEKIRLHIEQARIASAQFDPAMKLAYAWWTKQFFEGLVLKSFDFPRDIDSQKTILVFCEIGTNSPRKNDIVYFELPLTIGRIQSLKADVHFFIFESLPGNPQECLNNIRTAKTSLWGRVQGVENDQGGQELRADWYLDSQQKLVKTGANFRPTPTANMQQVRVKLSNHVFDVYEYLFGKQSISWTPIYDHEARIEYPGIIGDSLAIDEVVPIEAKPWFLVTGLAPEDTNSTNKGEYYKALEALAPSSGNYILFSTARRKIENKQPTNEDDKGHYDD